MKKQLWIPLAVVLFLSGMNVALAQHATTLSFSAPFPFEVGDIIFPASDYQITYDGSDPNHLQLLDTKTNKKQFITFLTRLSQRAEGSVVFDSAHNMRFLSEVYFGKSDGFQVRTTHEAHTHVVEDGKITD